MRQRRDVRFTCTSPKSLLLLSNKDYTHIYVNIFDYVYILIFIMYV